MGTHRVLCALSKIYVDGKGYVLQGSYPFCVAQTPVPHLGFYSRHVLTDASRMGWGAVIDGRPAQGIWRGHHFDLHINSLELMAVFLTLKYFLQQLRG